MTVAPNTHLGRQGWASDRWLNAPRSWVVTLLLIRHQQAAGCSRYCRWAELLVVTGGPAAANIGALQVLAGFRVSSPE